MTFPPVPTRTGWGFDAHRVGGDPPLVLGGVVVSDSVGVIATSDGDVLAHAITDAILGAAAIGDMGTYFPSDDPEYAAADSIDLLAQAISLARHAGWQVGHVDGTVITEAVRVSPLREKMRERLAMALGVDVGRVSVKATTTDGLGPFDDGIAAVAVVTMVEAS